MMEFAKNKRKKLLYTKVTIVVIIIEMLQIEWGT